MFGHLLKQANEARRNDIGGFDLIYRGKFENTLYGGVFCYEILYVDIF